MSKSVATQDQLAKLVADAIARWHGNMEDRRPLEQAILQAIEPHLIDENVEPLRLNMLASPDHYVIQVTMKP